MDSRQSILCVIFLIGVSVSCCFGYGYNYHWLEDDCNRSIYLGVTNDSQSLYGFVRVTREEGYSPDLDCGLTVNAPVGYRLVVRIRRIEIYQQPGSGRTCTNDKMSIIGNSSKLTYCGFGRPNYAILSSTNFLTFHMFSEPRDWENDWLGFDLYYTAFHTKSECDQSIGDDGIRKEFRCSSGSRCVPGELTCDMFDNCGDWSDEQVTTCGLSYGAKVAIGVVCGIVIAALVGFVTFYAYTKKKEKELRQRARNGVVPTVTADNLGPSHLNNQDEPPPPYTYSVVYNAAPLPPIPADEQNQSLQNTEAPPPAYTETADTVPPATDSRLTLQTAGQDNKEATDTPATNGTVNPAFRGDS